MVTLSSIPNWLWIFAMTCASTSWVWLPMILSQARTAIFLSLVFGSSQCTVIPRYPFLLADQQSAVVPTHLTCSSLLKCKHNGN